jgi:hypothetical protein
VIGGAYLVATTGVQTISDKTLDDSNSVTLLSSNFALEQTAGGHTATFTTTDLTGNRAYGLPDVSMVLIGRSGGAWSTTSLGMTGGTGTYNTIQLAGSSGIDRFFRFRSGGGGLNGFSGITLSAFDGANWSLFGDTNNGADFAITFNSSVPVGNDEVGYRVLAIDETSKNLKLYQFGDDTIYERFDVSGLTAARTASFPDVDCPFLCTTATQTVSNKIIDDTNSVTVLSGNFRLEQTAGGHSARFSTSDLTSSPVFHFPDTPCTFLCTIASQTVSNKIIDDTNSITTYDNKLLLESSTSSGSDIALSIPNLGGVTRTWSFPGTYDNATFLGATSTGIVNYGQTLKFGDSHTELYSFADGTKGGFFDLSLLSTATIRTWYLPDSDCALLGDVAVQTISNKQIDDTNSITVLDNHFLLTSAVNSNSSIQFSVPDLGNTTTTWSFPNYLPYNFTFLGVGASGYINYGQTLRFGADHFLLYGNAHATSGVVFNHDNISLLTIRTAYFPDVDCTFLCETASQTVTNKVITDPSNSVRATEIAINDTASVTIVPSASAVSTGDVLTATSETTAQWKPATTVNLGSYGFRAVKNTQQYIPNDSGTVVRNWLTDGTQGSNDPGSNFDTTTGAFTAPVTGYYNIQGNVGFGYHATGYRQAYLQYSGYYNFAFSDPERNSITDTTIITSANHMLLPAGAVIYVLLYQNSGSSIATPADHYMAFGATCVGLA